jgi:hypothetical protein
MLPKADEFAGLSSADEVLAMIRRELGDAAADAIQASLKAHKG